MDFDNVLSIATQNQGLSSIPVSISRYIYIIQSVKQIQIYAIQAFGRSNFIVVLLLKLFFCCNMSKWHVFRVILNTLCPYIEIKAFCHMDPYGSRVHMATAFSHVCVLQKRYSLKTGPPKKDDKVKGVNSAAVQAFLKKQAMEERQKGTFFFIILVQLYITLLFKAIACQVIVYLLSCHL